MILDNVPAWLPQVALHQLRWPIDRPLERALDQEPRPDLPHICVKDALPARIADLRSEIRNRCDGTFGSACNCSQIQSLNGSTMDPAHAREYRGGASATSNLPTVSRAQPRPATNLPRRKPLHPLHPSDLGPLLHVDHRLPPVRSNEIERASRPSRTSRPPRQMA
jgi:hypothetical protein